ncbi:LuxR C-terminal-related transcriptional regulator [Marinactinospora thermotolerans]|uniref:Response regulator containing a CheY-like receiver domain and an HTH DNA-binding domain n=1 Tax=Marinactinospora thermotolerans DSM 45154 TaxID=1122192 RepID=A0A1T4R3K6_9ACTN|nr:LuxR C-terminal-related transcriptional regulator [Marinactinospora thermotolerans]SKA10261.1 Response regulator containing a CheY-like receiver domain and an HTH DNA-binding domain [Marinactinospora thermotolerans DSM 45154]
MNSALMGRPHIPTARTPPLRGRQREMAMVVDALENSWARESTFIFVEGTIGSGKTRFLRECIETARDMGLGVSRRNLLHGPASRLPEEGEGDGRGLVVIDDADLLSVLEIDGLVSSEKGRGRQGVVWLVARRVGNCSRHLHSRLSLPGDEILHIPLGSIPPAEAAVLAADLLGAPLSLPVAELVRRTGGHPKLLVELLNGMLEEQTLLVTSAEVRLLEDRLPERLYRWVKAVLDESSPQCRQFLRVAAALGDRMSLDRVRAMLGLRLVELLPLIDEARALGLMTTSPDLTFHSPLVHQVLSAMVPSELRRILRREVGGPQQHEGGGVLLSEAKTRRLTDKERAIVRLLAQGMTNGQVARRLTISPNTVNYHLKKLFRHYGVNSRVELLNAVGED